jgi:hypothetical protein
MAATAVSVVWGVVVARVPPVLPVITGPRRSRMVKTVVSAAPVGVAAPGVPGVPGGWGPTAAMMEMTALPVRFVVVGSAVPAVTAGTALMPVI